MLARLGTRPAVAVRTGHLWTTRLTTEETGALGEELAARHLRRQGLRLIGRNLQAAEAELDLVARDGRSTIVVIEVKAGWWPERETEEEAEEAAREHPVSPRRRARPAARVTPTGLARRARAAGRISRSLGLGAARVDVIEVIFGRSSTAILRWHKDVTARTLGRWHES